MLKRKRVKIGDVFQILTADGVCYGQIINKHPKWSYVVAIFREFYEKTPDDFTEVVNKEPQFITTFLIQDAVSQGLFSLVANAEIAEKNIKFPIFKGTNNFEGEKTMWFFWDGTEEWKVHRPLSEVEKKYPEGPTLISAPLLIERIQNNYRVEKDYV